MSPDSGWRGKHCRRLQGTLGRFQRHHTPATARSPTRCANRPRPTPTGQQASPMLPIAEQPLRVG
eukprot:2527990-Lingulodinium_polyedra.AAC.1